jgi:AraC-like DNA-binding protein/mannose-6-phosphate isomerase-like protein (cupin superfamily)
MVYPRGMDKLTVLPDQSEIVHYDDPLFPLYLRENTLSLYPLKKVLCHWHPDMEFFYVEKGHPSYFVNGTIVPLKEGEVLFVNSKVMHYGFSPDGIDSTYLCLVFHPSLLSPNPTTADHYVTPVSDNPDLPYVLFSKEVGQGLAKEMTAIFALLQEKKPGYPLLVLSHLYAFWSLFLSLKGQEQEQILGSSEKAVLVKTMLSYLYQHYQEPVSLTDLAQAGALSESYASHLFMAQLGDSPIQYLNRYRLEKGAELLLDPTQRISDIAQAVGFESSSYFTELFKRSKGLSPRDYRKKYLPE